MFVRIISALVLIPLLIFCVQRGGAVLFLFLLGISLIGLFELFRVFEHRNYRLIKKAVYILTIITYVFIYLFPVEGLLFHLTPVLILVATLYAIRGNISIEELALSVMSYLYLPISLSYIYFLREKGGHYVWIVFILAYATDTFAYFTGGAIGRHKLIPKVSPKKTVEGAIGGVAGAIICCLLFEHYFGHASHYIRIVILAAAGSIASQLGDLLASFIKREFEVKDYGKLIPGHGGVLDRVDSVLFTAPLTYYGLLFLGVLGKMM